MSYITGVVESVAHTGKGIKVQGEWYGAFAASSLNGCKAGDTVSFAWSPSKDGRYKNIKGSVNVTGGGAATPTSPEASAPRSAPSGGSYGRSSITFPLPPLDGQRVIVRQNALGHATKILVEGYHLKEKLEDGFDTEICDRIIAMARQFESYVAGDLDLELAKEA